MNMPCEDCITRSICANKYKLECVILYNWVLRNATMDDDAFTYKYDTPDVVIEFELLSHAGRNVVYISDIKSKLIRTLGGALSQIIKTE
jgi:hypothetical protein